MYTKPSSCNGCPIYGDGIGFIKYEGNPLLGVTLVGTYPSIVDLEAGLPYRPNTGTGSQLEKLFRICGVKREQFRIGTVISCQPPAGKLEWMPYESEAIQKCRSNLRRVLRNDAGDNSNGGTR